MCQLNEEYKKEELKPIKNPYEFTLQRLDSFRNFSSKVHYCKQHLHLLGKGSSRMVFLLDENKVLKLAYNEAGLAQNSVENNPEIHEKYGKILNKIYRTSHDLSWVIAQRTLVPHPKELQNHIGMTIQEMIDYQEATHKNSFENNPEMLIELYEKYSEENENKPIAREIIDMALYHNFLGGDFIRYDSWGKVDGDFKIHDYGLTKEVWDEYYYTPDYENEIDKIKENKKIEEISL